MEREPKPTNEALDHHLRAGQQHHRPRGLQRNQRGAAKGSSF
jgi:hypothetical protein